MLMKTRQISHLDSTWRRSLVKSNHNPSSKPAVLSIKQSELGFRFRSSHAGFLKYNKISTRNVIVYSSMEPPGPPPPGPPPNTISWIVAVVVAVVIPLVNYKWGPALKKKIESAMQITEDVVEAVEKVAGDVEKVAEDIADDLPIGGKFREAVDFVENLAERAARDAGAIDDFIDKVQEEEEKSEQFAESVEEKLEKPPEKSNDGIPKQDNFDK